MAKGYLITKYLRSEIPDGINYDPKINIDFICNKFNINNDQLISIVNNDKKTRMIIENNQIFCCQGHFLDKNKPKNDKTKSQIIENLILKKINYNNIPTFLFHGTEKNKISSIQKSKGLSRMERTHIHMIGPESNASVNEHQKKPISGFRNDSNFIIKINTEICKQYNISFFKSKNDVYLTSGNKNGIIPLNALIFD